MTQEYLHLAAQLGCKDDGKGLQLTANPQEIDTLQKQIPQGGPLIGFAPGAAFGPSKRWPPERYAATADRLHQQANARCLLLTGPGEEKTRDTIQTTAKHPLLTCNQTPTTIATLKAAISQLDLLICNDSGPRHIAIAFGVPTICIMGPTDPAYSCGPYERGAILRVNVDCGPCQKPTCATDHRCMTRITIDTVVTTALQHLPKTRP